jgi:hypothetical protein
VLGAVHANIAKAFLRPALSVKRPPEDVARRLHARASRHRFLRASRDPTVINIGPEVMKTVKLTLLLVGALAVVAPLAYSADAPGSGAAAKAPASKAHVLSRAERAGR